jgi:hypothetical protein
MLTHTGPLCMTGGSWPPDTGAPEDSLAGVTPGKLLFDIPPNLSSRLVPPWPDQLSVRRMAEEPFDADRGTQPLEKIRHKLEIFDILEKPVRGSSMLQRHRRIPDNMEMVDFYGVEPHFGESRRHPQHFGARFPRKAENHMRPEPDTTATAACDRLHPASVVVAAIDASEGGIVDRLKPVLDHDEAPSSRLLEPCKFVVVDAVRTGSDRKTRDIPVSQCRLIERDQLFKRSMGVAERLKIDDELARTIAGLEMRDAAPNLFGDRKARIQTMRAERIVVAVNAASYSQSPIPVRAAEPRIHTDLADAATESLPQV